MSLNAPRHLDRSTFWDIFRFGQNDRLEANLSAYLHLAGSKNRPRHNPLLPAPKVKEKFDEAFRTDSDFEIDQLRLKGDELQITLKNAVNTHQFLAAVGSVDFDISNSEHFTWLLEQVNQFPEEFSETFNFLLSSAFSNSINNQTEQVNKIVLDGMRKIREAVLSSQPAASNFLQRSKQLAARLSANALRSIGAAQSDERLLDSSTQVQHVGPQVSLSDDSVAKATRAAFDAAGEARIEREIESRMKGWYWYRSRSMALDAFIQDFLEGQGPHDQLICRMLVTKYKAETLRYLHGRSVLWSVGHANTVRAARRARVQGISPFFRYTDYEKTLASIANSLLPMDPTAADLSENLLVKWLRESDDTRDVLVHEIKTSSDYENYKEYFQQAFANSDLASLFPQESVSEESVEAASESDAFSAQTAVKAKDAFDPVADANASASRTDGVEPEGEADTDVSEHSKVGSEAGSVDFPSELEVIPAQTALEVKDGFDSVADANASASRTDGVEAEGKADAVVSEDFKVGSEVGPVESASVTSSKSSILLSSGSEHDSQQDLDNIIEDADPSIIASSDDKPLSKEKEGSAYHRSSRGPYSSATSSELGLFSPPPINRAARSPLQEELGLHVREGETSDEVLETKEETTRLLSGAPVSDELIKRSEEIIKEVLTKEFLDRASSLDFFNLFKQYGSDELGAKALIEALKFNDINLAEHAKALEAAKNKDYKENIARISKCNDSIKFLNSVESKIHKAQEKLLKDKKDKEAYAYAVSENNKDKEPYAYALSENEPILASSKPDIESVLDRQIQLSEQETNNFNAFAMIIFNQQSDSLTTSLVDSVSSFDGLSALKSGIKEILSEQDAELTCLLQSKNDIRVFLNNEVFGSALEDFILSQEKDIEKGQLFSIFKDCFMPDDGESAAFRRPGNSSDVIDPLDNSELFPDELNRTVDSEGGILVSLSESDESQTQTAAWNAAIQRKFERHAVIEQAQANILAKLNANENDSTSSKSSLISSSDANRTKSTVKFDDAVFDSESTKSTVMNFHTESEATKSTVFGGSSNPSFLSSRARSPVSSKRSQADQEGYQQGAEKRQLTT